MKPLHYDIIRDDGAWQVVIVINDEHYPIPKHRYSSYHIASMAIKLLQREDFKLWQQTSLNPRAEYDGFGTLITEEDHE